MRSVDAAATWVAFSQFGLDLFDTSISAAKSGRDFLGWYLDYARGIMCMSLVWRSLGELEIPEGTRKTIDRKSD
jgi:hypothetical protein